MKYTHTHNEPTAYEVLGLPPTATAQEIQATMRRLVTSYHPDRQPQSRKALADKRFRAVVDAYEKLKTPQARQQYDALLRLQKSPISKRKASNDNNALQWLKRCVKTFETIFWPLGK